MFRKIPNYGQGQSSTKKVWKRNLKIKKKKVWESLLCTQWMYLKKAQIKITKYYVHFSSFEEKVSDDQAQKLLWITFLIQPKIYSY